MVIIASLLLGLPLVAIALFFLWASSGTRSPDEYEAVVSYRDTVAEPNVAEVNPNSITIATYNIGYLSGLTNNLAVERQAELFETNLQQAIATFAPLQPDILALQEVDFGARRSFYQNQAEAVAQALGFTTGAIAINWDKRYVPFPYWPPSTHFGQVVSGQAVLTRFPVQNNLRVVLQKVAGKPFFYNALYLDRLAQITALEVAGQRLVIINVHLEAFDEPTRRQQTETVRSFVEFYGDEVPIILLGDFNSVPPDSESPNSTIQTILEMPALKPAFAEEIRAYSTSGASGNEAGAIATFPSDQPVAKLDYIFYTPSHIEALNWRIVSEAEQASDHLPLVMEFRLRR
ncbi:MAG: endonuclease/exonuclease/phosphatase family protein [Elainellaceae cyanobacterium]